MKFLIADTFPKALSKLTAQEQKSVKTSVFDLQIDPANPGLKFHRIDKSKDENFWSMRVSRDIRLIIHKTANSFLVCYVDHHDDAYAWAERRRIDTHPRTGAAQIVEVRERIEEQVIYHQAVEQQPPPAPLPFLFEKYDDEKLLNYGVPEDWLADVKSATEETLFDLTEHLPGEAADALLSLAVGEMPEMAAPTAKKTQDPFSHPDAQRRFRTMENIDELKRALEFPWDLWTVFLHPSQTAVVEQNFNGPVRVYGSAGTGKTVVALHRAARLLNSETDVKLLLTTFSLPLANELEKKLEILTGEDTGLVPQATILPFKEVARQMFALAQGYEPRVARENNIQDALQKAAEDCDYSERSVRFIYSEWQNVVDAWQLADLEAYAAVPRLGRKSRLGANQRATLWPVFERMRKILESNSFMTWSMIYGAVTQHYTKRDHKPFTHTIVDEAQDLSVAELRMLAALTPDSENALFFAGDIGQRIFEDPFSWKALGIDIRGRSKTLKVNYRTSHQIRKVADRLLPASVSDVDGNEQNRKGTVSVFNGPEPECVTFDDETAETKGIIDWLKAVIDSAIPSEEIGIFVRSENEMPRARAVIDALNLNARELTEKLENADGRISIGSMHYAKGLEFRAIVVMACDDEILPLQSRIDAVGDTNDLQNILDTERQLFYVACTRARDRLLVTGVNPASDFIEDMRLDEQ